MGIYKAIVNYDEMFRNQIIPPVCVNDLPNLSEEDRQRNNDLIFRELSGEFDTTPRCACGKTTKERRIGFMCPYCNEPVRDVIETPPMPRLWLRPPAGIKTKLFINPQILRLLSVYFTKVKKATRSSYTVTTTGKPKSQQEGFNPLAWLGDTSYNPKDAEGLIANLRREFKGQRGYSFLVNNISTILNKLFEMPDYKDRVETKKSELMTIINRASKEGSFFCHHLPVVDRSLIAVETEGAYRYIDKAGPLAVNAVRQVLGIDTPGSGLRAAARENRAFKTILEYNRFALEYARLNISSKPGLARENMFASRVSPSARAVIGSLTIPHQYDEIFMPWSAAVGMFRTHLQNYLIRFGFTPLQMTELLNYATTNYHPLIDYCFKDMIKHSRDNGMWVLFIRNPSLTIWVKKFHFELFIKFIMVKISEAKPWLVTAIE